MDTPTVETRPTIVTRYHSPTNYRGARISARTASGLRLIVSYEHALSDTENHGAAAVALARKLNWIDTNGARLCGGDLRDGERVFVIVR